jgi:hypothetical protein
LTRPIDLERKIHSQLLNLLNCCSKEEEITEKTAHMLKQAFIHEDRRSLEGRIEEALSVLKAACKDSGYLGANPN